jgi:hypothetical protein
MSKLLIQTQIQENYGAHDWDGQGQCPQYWKFKGGNDYVIKNVDPLKVAPGLLVDSVRGKIETDNEYVREWVNSWEVVEDDYLTDFERSQLEYEGKITYPAEELFV